MRRQRFMQTGSNRSMLQKSGRPPRRARGVSSWRSSSLCSACQTEVCIRVERAVARSTVLSLIPRGCIDNRKSATCRRYSQAGSVRAQILISAVKKAFPPITR